MSKLPTLADWAEKLQLIAQAGLTYSQNPYDLQRFGQIQQIVSEMLEAETGIPQQKIRGLLAEERGEEHPIVIGGGPCAYNAEPVADFFDIFSIGEGEEALLLALGLELGQAAPFRTLGG